MNVGQNGTLQGINGSLYIDNVQLSSFVTLDDSKDPTARQNVDLEPLADLEAVLGLAPNGIYLTDADIFSATIKFGTPQSGHNSVTLLNTTPNGPNINFVGGNAGDEADIQANIADVTVQNFATVKLGNPQSNLDHIANVSVIGSGATTLSLDDEANRNQLANIYFFRTSPTYTFARTNTSQVILRDNPVDTVFVALHSDPSALLTSGPVLSTTDHKATINYSNLASVSLQGGHSVNKYNVEDTPTGTSLAIHGSVPIANDMFSTQERHRQRRKRSGQSRAKHA